MPFITRADIEFLPKQGFYVKKINTCYNAPGFSAIYKHNEPDWTKNYDPKQLKQATNRGANFDNCIQAFYESNRCDLACKNLLLSIDAFTEHIKPIAQELFVFSKLKQLPVLGFIDAVACIRAEQVANLAKVKIHANAEPTDGLTIIDWKTKHSANFNPVPLGRYIVQVSVYAKLAKVFYGLDIQQACIAIAFASGEPCQLLWLDKTMIREALNIFAGKLHSYKNNMNHSWRGAYELK